MKSRIVIVAYKPKPGKEEALVALAKNHHAELDKLGLVTNRLPVLMQSLDKTVIEVFEWKSSDAIQQAHGNPAVHKMWAEYSEVCDYIPIGNVTETSSLFSEFSPVE